MYSTPTKMDLSIEYFLITISQPFFVTNKVIVVKTFIAIEAAYCLTCINILPKTCDLDWTELTGQRKGNLTSYDQSAHGYKGLKHSILQS